MVLSSMNFPSREELDRRIEEGHREIQRSFARMIALLEEEIAERESEHDALPVSTGEHISSEDASDSMYYALSNAGENFPSMKLDDLDSGTDSIVDEIHPPTGQTDSLSANSLSAMTFLVEAVTPTNDVDNEALTPMMTNPPYQDINTAHPSPSNSIYLHGSSRQSCLPLQFPLQITVFVLNRHVFDEMPLRNRVPKTDLPHQFRALVTRSGVFNTPGRLPPPKPPDRSTISMPSLEQPILMLPRQSPAKPPNQVSHATNDTSCFSTLNFWRSCLLSVRYQIKFEYHAAISFILSCRIEKPKEHIPLIDRAHNFSLHALKSCVVFYNDLSSLSIHEERKLSALQNSKSDIVGKLIFKEMCVIAAWPSLVAGSDKREQHSNAIDLVWESFDQMVDRDYMSWIPNIASGSSSGFVAKVFQELCSINCDLLNNVQDSDKPPYEKNKEFNDKLIYSLSVQSNEVKMHYLKFLFEGFKCPIVVFQEMSLRMSKALQKIDHYTLSSILNGCIVLTAYMRYVQCWIIKRELELSKLVCDTTATMDAKCDYLNAMIHAMFVSMQFWDTSTWPPLVVYAHHGKGVGSFRFYVAEVFKYSCSFCQWQSTKVQKDARTIFTWLVRVLLEKDILIASTVVNVTQPAVVGEEENVAGLLPFTFSSKRDMTDIDSCKVCQIALDKPGGKPVLLGLLGLLVQATIDGVAMYSTNEWAFHAILYDSRGRDALEFIYAILRDSFVCSVNMLYFVMAPCSIKAVVNWDLLESFRLSKCPQYQLNQRIFVPPKWQTRKSKDVFDFIGQDEQNLEAKLPNICTAAMSILILWLDGVQLLFAIFCACLASHYVIRKIVERQCMLNADTVCNLTVFQQDLSGYRLVAGVIRLQSAYGLDVDMYICKFEDMQQQVMSATNMQVGESSNVVLHYLFKGDNGTKQLAEILSANYSLQFRQWDPGGDALAQEQDSFDLGAICQDVTITTTILTSTLRTRLF